MIKAIIVALIFIRSVDISAQIIQKVDVVPYTADCDEEETLEQAVMCSEGMLLDYFLRSVDTVACPHSDTSKRVSVVMDVDWKGRYTVKVRSHEMRPSCLEYFEEKGFEMPEAIQLFPALLDNKEVTFNKRLNFYYPSWDSKYVKKDSLSDAIYRAEEMPRFYGCEDMLGGPEDKNTCAKNQMLRFMYKTLRYPSEARERGVQGMVVIKFIVNEKGYIEEPYIDREIGGGCGDASLDVVNKMNKIGGPPFVPGKIDGKPVNVMYTLPFRFKLEK